MPERELLDEQIICQNGSWQRVRRWWRGAHPQLGIITLGWSGWETIEERDRLRPVHTFLVVAEHVYPAEQPVPAKAA
jgi:hypothetical protein